MTIQVVDKYAICEGAFRTSGSYDNPYTDVFATATCTRPDGGTVQIPLFTDGGNSWRVRISPDTTGEWRLRVASSDSGLDLSGAKRLAYVPVRPDSNFHTMKRKSYDSR